MDLFDFSVGVIGFFCLAYFSVNIVRALVQRKIDRDIDNYIDSAIGV